MDVVEYSKKCKLCGREFTSTSRNTRYCSEECFEKAQRANKARQKKLKKRREDYDNNVVFQRLLSRAYALSQAVAEECVTKECALCGRDSTHVCEGSLELHHKDSNPFNISIDNLVWLS